MVRVIARARGFSGHATGQKPDEGKVCLAIPLASRCGFRLVLCCPPFADGGTLAEFGHQVNHKMMPWMAPMGGKKAPSNPTTWSVTVDCGNGSGGATATPYVVCLT